MSSSKLASNPPLQADGVSLMASLNLSDGRERPREDHSDLRPSFNRHSARPARRWIHGHIYPTILSFQDKFTLFLPELDKLVVRSSPQSIVDDAGKRSVVKRASSPPDEDSKFRLPKSMYGSVDGHPRTHHLINFILFTDHDYTSLDMHWLLAVLELATAH